MKQKKSRKYLGAPFFGCNLCNNSDIKISKKVKKKNKSNALLGALINKFYYSITIW